MIRECVPVQKIGTLFQIPCWRYTACRYPEKFKFHRYVSGYVIKGREGSSVGSFMSRLPEVTRQVTFVYPSYLTELCDTLSHEESVYLKSLWSKSWKKRGSKKVMYFPSQRVVCWKMNELKNIGDEYLIKLIRHIYGDEGNAEISFALELADDKHRHETFKFLGYYTFAGLSDIEIAKRVKISPKRVEAVRKIFFDFSHFPEDRVFRWALLNQLSNSKLLDDNDVSFLKQISAMGMLGLEAVVDYYNLSINDKNLVEQYLSSTPITNALRLHFSVKTTKDALNYARVVSDASRTNIERERLRLVQAQIDLLKVRAKQIDLTQGLDVSKITTEDQKLLTELRSINQSNIIEVPCISVTDLK